MDPKQVAVELIQYAISQGKTTREVWGEFIASKGISDPALITRVRGQLGGAVRKVQIQERKEEKKRLAATPPPPPPPSLEDQVRRLQQTQSPPPPDGSPAPPPASPGMESTWTGQLNRDAIQKARENTVSRLATSFDAIVEKILLDDYRRALFQMWKTRHDYPGDIADFLVDCMDAFFKERGVDMEYVERRSTIYAR